MADPSIYRIHPAVGIARLGDSPDEPSASRRKSRRSCRSNATPTAMPPRAMRRSSTSRTARAASSARPRASRSSSMTTSQSRRRRAEDRRPCRGRRQQGKLVDIQWRVQLANKKAAWFTFDGLRGEAGYPDGTPLRNPDITDPIARQKLVIDAGPQAVDLHRAAQGELRARHQSGLCRHLPAERDGAQRHRHAGRHDDGRQRAAAGARRARQQRLVPLRLRPSAHRDLRQQRRLVRRHLGRAGDGAAGDDGGARPGSCATSTSNIPPGCWSAIPATRRKCST